MSPIHRHHAAGRLHRTKAFAIPGLPGRYPLTVYLPPDYDHGNKYYPVAYMFDGQNLYHDAGSYSGAWHMHAALDARAAKGKTVPIVIGLHHGGVSRIEELSPWPVGRGKSGRGDALLDWMVGDLRWFVAEDLRVLQGPEHTAIGGSSLGGLMALYGALKHPGVFGSALVMSPALWVKQGAIFGVAEHAYVPHAGRRLYLDAGGREGRMFQAAEQMAQLLARQGHHAGTRVMWRPDKRGSHNERNWRRRLPKALRFLYD